MGKTADAPPEKASKARGSTGTAEDLSAWNFVRVGLALTLIFAAMVMLVAGLGRITPDTIPRRPLCIRNAADTDLRRARSGRGPHPAHSERAEGMGESSLEASRGRFRQLG
jgi:hypothetical protein